VKTINRQSLKSPASAAHNMLWLNIVRFYNNILLIGLLIFSLQIISFAVDDPNQSTTKEEQASATTIRDVFLLELPHKEMVENITQILRTQTLEESLSKLYQIDLYICTAQVFMEIPHSRIPLDASVGQRDMVAIMGNRRFLKVIHELSLLPKEKAAALVNKEITSSLDEYKRLFDSYMAKNDEGFKRNLTNPKGARSVPLLFYHHVKDGTPTLSAVRFKVLALALIAGNLQLQQTQAAVSKVLETAIEQRDTFYKKGYFHKRDAWGMLMKGSLYNRQIIGTSVLGTYISPVEGEQILKDFYCKLKSERLTHYNASFTLYGLHHMLEMVPVDYSKGELNVKCLEPLDDFKFDGIVNAATKARQQNIIPTEPVE